MFKNSHISLLGYSPPCVLYYRKQEKADLLYQYLSKRGLAVMRVPFTFFVGCRMLCYILTNVLPSKWYLTGFIASQSSSDISVEAGRSSMLPLSSKRMSMPFKSLLGLG